MKSVIQKEKECFFCGSTQSLECHHIFFSSLRPASDRCGMKVWLCQFHHRDQKNGVHGNRELDLKLKRKAQEVFEAKHGHEKFMQVFGRNYL